MGKSRIFLSEVYARQNECWDLRDLNMGASLIGWDTLIQYQY